MGRGSPPAVQLLYLISYALAAMGIILPAAFLRAKSNVRLVWSGRFLVLFSLTAILPSLQVLLNAIGLTDSLPGIWPEVLTAGFNTLILAGLWAVSAGWHRLTRTFSPRKFLPDRIHRPVYRIFVGITAVTAGAQIVAVIDRSGWSASAVRYALAIYFVGVIRFIVEGWIRILRRRAGGTAAELWILRLLPVAALIGIALSVSLPGRPASAMAVCTLIIVQAALLTVFLRQTRNREDEEAARNTIFSDAGLTPREREIAEMLARGLSYKEVSAELFVSLSTVQTHVTRIYAKLEVRSKTELSRKLSAR